MFQAKVVDKIKTHFMINNFFFSKNLAVGDVMWKSAVEFDRLLTTIRRMRIACWLPRATDTHSQQAVLIAVTLQQWLTYKRFIATLYVH
jgi:hypothetical protein